MKVSRLRRPKLAISSIITVGVAALSVPLFNLSSVSAANTVTGSNALVSVSSLGGGDGANLGASMGTISDDGNIVIFNSRATNLPATATSTASSAPFVRNISEGTTSRLDTSVSGAVGDAITLTSDQTIFLSRNGRYTLFSSNSTNLIDGTTVNPNYKFQTYIKDLQTGVVQLLSDPNDAAPSGTTSLAPFAVSDDGRFVFVNTLYASSYTSVGPSSGSTDILMYDRAKSIWTQVVNPGSGITPSTGSKASQASCDGSLVIFRSAATNLTPGYSGSGTHVFLGDLRNGITLTDITPGATEMSYSPSISCNGRYITFWTKDRTLVNPTPSGLSTDPHAVRYDRLTGQYMYVDSNSSGSFTASPPLTSMGLMPVSDKGDVVVLYSTNVYLKHLSDGSGTLETFQMNPTSGTRYTYSDQLYKVKLSTDGKYLAYGTTNAGSMGVLTSGGSAQVVRTVTGL